MQKKVKIYLFIDALGWEIVQRHKFMLAEFPERRKISMQFGYSCSAIPTILSGEQPTMHGHLSLFNYAPGSSPFKLLRPLHWLLRPASFWNRGRIRNQLSKIIRRLYGFTGYFQIYRMAFDRLGMMDYAEKKDIFIPGGLDGIPNLADMLQASGLKYHISDWRRTEEENFAAGRRELQGGQCDFLFLYTAALDGLLHNHPCDDATIGKKLAFYERNIRELLSVARANYADVQMTVISDHGMTPLSGTIDLPRVFAINNWQFNRDYAACFDSTMLRLYVLKEELRIPIMHAVSAACPAGRWLSDTEEKNYGIYRADRKFGDNIFLLPPGMQIVPSDMGGRALNGMHGYAPEDKDSAAMVISNAPLDEKIHMVADFFHLMRDGAAELKEEKSR